MGTVLPRQSPSFAAPRPAGGAVRWCGGVLVMPDLPCQRVQHVERPVEPAGAALSSAALCSRRLGQLRLQLELTAAQRVCGARIVAGVEARAHL